MTNLKSSADTCEDIRTAIFSLAYQHIAEEQWGDEDSKWTPDQIGVTVRNLKRAYAKLTSKSDADDVYRVAYRNARRRVNGD